jgi:hypothetical protein
MTRNLVAAVGTLLLALVASPAFADDPAAMMKEMHDNHKAMALKMGDMMTDMHDHMEMHSKALKGDKSQKANLDAINAMAKLAKSNADNFKKMAAEMDKMKDMKPMDPSKIDAKAKEMMDKHMADEKELIGLMQKDQDMGAKMAAAASAAPATATPAATAAPAK